MRKRWIILIACVAVTAGFFAGAYAGVRFWQRFDEVALETRYLADAKVRLTVLSSLRNSNQDRAVLLLENLLDGDVIGLDSVKDTSTRKVELLATLSQVSEYRAKTNYRSSNGEVASLVERALKRATQPNNTVERDAPQAARPSP